MTVNLSRRAERDLRRLDPEVRGWVIEGLVALERGGPNPDVKVLRGHGPLCRYRIGQYRVPFLARRGRATPTRPLILVERIMSRAELERAVGTLADVED